MKGVVNILKPPGLTSHDVVDLVRKKLKTRKVGHTGTLDPGACGVLVLSIGKATKITDFLIKKRKEYIFELSLGISTDTLDDDGNILDKVTVTDENVRQLLKGYHDFIGENKQVPPMYSAIKKQGKKLYELARSGETVDRDPRRVSIYNLELINRYKHKSMERFLFRVECSKGTYIRVLAEELSKMAGTLGYMSFLLRTRVGPFTIEDTVRIEDFMNEKDKEKLKEYIISMDKALCELPFVVLSGDNSKLFKSGNFVKTSIDENVNTLYRVYTEDGVFLGIGRIVQQNKLKPEKVLV